MQSCTSVRPVHSFQLQLWDGVPPVTLRYWAIASTLATWWSVFRRSLPVSRRFSTTRDSLGGRKSRHGTLQGWQARDADLEFVQRRPGVGLPAQDRICARDADLEFVQRRPGVQMGFARGMQILSSCRHLSWELTQNGGHVPRVRRGGSSFCIQIGGHVPRDPAGSAFCILV